MTTILQDFALGLIALFLFGYCAYSLGCLEAAYDDAFASLPNEDFCRQIEGKDLSTKDIWLREYNDGFTDCDLFD